MLSILHFFGGVLPIKQCRFLKIASNPRPGIVEVIILVSIYRYVSPISIFDDPGI